MSVRNESDILSYTIEHLLNNDIEIIILDDESSDSTPQIIGRYLGLGILQYIRRDIDKMDVIGKFEILHNAAKIYTPEIALICDADEIMVTDREGETLREGIERVYLDGYSAINFALIEFKVTDKDDSLIPSPIERMKYFWNVEKSVQWRAYHVKAYDRPYTPHTVELAHLGYPSMFLIKHYPYRSVEQANQKINDRRKRYMGDGRGGHYFSNDTFKLESSVTNMRNIDACSFVEIRALIEG